MRCGCPECGVYMIQREQGLHSHCVCPNCGCACGACMGGETGPATKEALMERLKDTPENTGSSK